MNHGDAEGSEDDWDKRRVRVAETPVEGTRAGPVCLFTAEGGGAGAEAFESGFDVLDDLLGEVGGLGQAVEVGEAVVLQPEEVEAGFIAGGQLGVGELPPGTFSSSPSSLVKVIELFLPKGGLAST